MKKIISLILLSMFLSSATVSAQQVGDSSAGQSLQNTGLGLQQPQTTGFQGSSPTIVPENSGLNQTGRDSSISLSSIPNTTTAKVTPKESSPISKTLLLILLIAVAIAAYSFWSWSTRPETDK